MKKIYGNSHPILSIDYLIKNTLNSKEWSMYKFVYGHTQDNISHKDLLNFWHKLCYSEMVIRARNSFALFDITQL